MSETLRDEELRPRILLEGRDAALQKDLDWLQARRSEFVDVACPACGATGGKPAFTKYTFSFVSCNGCATVYMTPRAPAGLLGEFYERSELYAYWDAHIFPASREARLDKIFRPRAQRLLELCTTHAVTPGTVIEAGAGYGLFALALQETGSCDRVIACEPNASLAATCRDAGLEVIEKPVETVTEELRADVIAAFEVIEHLFDPRVFLTGCRDRLAPGGLLVLSCPNWQGFDMETLGPLSDNVDAEHINLFNPESLSHLVESCGLETLEVATPGQLDAEIVRNKILDGSFDVSDKPWLRSLLIDRWEECGADFQRFLSEHTLSSHLWLAARRPA